MPTTADRLSRPLRRLDGPNLALQDRLNALVPWLWWPVGVPSADEPMRTGAHVLYAVHALAVARVLRVPRRPWAAAVAVASWALFSGAWDRRAAA